MCENILSYLNWCNTLSLRYFNPVGAHASGAIGELPLGTPNNLVPYLTQAMAGLRPPLTVHGSDYPTRDGSCIRDYIHVMDLADAHVCALNCLLNEKSQKPFDVINIGTGTGSTVLEVIKAFASANGLHVPYQIGPRRPGDVVQYLADTKKAEIVLGFKTKFTLTDMMRDAWNWQKNAPST
jgi:UDP-glucose 4-epimerase